MKDILIVEDGMQERARLERLFCDAGYAVQSCGTVAEAEKLLNRESFRIAMLDIGLSDKSGSHLFNTIKRGGKVTYIVIFTGNPSVHLKQRFLEEGAVDYIVKGSAQAQNEAILNRVRDLIGTTQSRVPTGIPLEEFLNSYVSEKSRNLFLDMDGCFPACKACQAREYVVTFSHKNQVPPELTGQVVCASCGRAMDTDIE